MHTSRAVLLSAFFGLRYFIFFSTLPVLCRKVNRVSGSLALSLLAPMSSDAHFAPIMSTVINISNQMKQPEIRRLIKQFIYAFALPAVSFPKKRYNDLKYKLFDTRGWQIDGIFKERAVLSSGDLVPVLFKICVWVCFKVYVYYAFVGDFLA